MSTPTFCPFCGKTGTLELRANNAFVEQGPYLRNRYAFEGDADQWVCRECREMFIPWKTDLEVLDQLVEAEDRGGEEEAIRVYNELVDAGRI